MWLSKLGISLFFLLLPAVVLGQVAFDSSTVTQSQSFTYTTSGSNRYLKVCAFSDAPDTATLITYGGFSLTLRSRVDTGNLRIDYWDLVNPASGSNTLDITTDGASVFSVESFTGVNQSTPIGTVGNNGQNFVASSNVTVGSQTNGLVTDCVIGDTAATITIGGSQTERFNGDLASYTIRGSTEPGASSVAMDWNWSSTQTAIVHVAMPLRPVTAATVVRHRPLVMP